MVTFREARQSDLPAIIDILAADDVTGPFEDNSPEAKHQYVEAFERIAQQEDNYLVVGVMGEKVVAVAQFVITPVFVFTGVQRMTIEAMLVDHQYRNQAIGTKLAEHVIHIAKQHGCDMVQLMTNNQRVHAHRFYKNLGFVDSHIGMRLTVT